MYKLQWKKHKMTFPEFRYISHLMFFIEMTFFLDFSYQLCTLRIDLTSNVVKSMCIALFQFHVCYYDAV